MSVRALGPLRKQPFHDQEPGFRSHRTAAVLEDAGLIENLRGMVKILNRKSLEAAACECYGVIQHLNGGLGLK